MKRGSAAKGKGKRAVPLRLAMVAWVFMVIGAVELADGIRLALQGTLSTDLGAILYVGLGVGLMRLWESWRIAALVLLWVILISLGSFLVLATFGGGTSQLVIHGAQALAPRWWSIAFGAAMFVVFLWQVRVLSHPEIASLFSARSEA